MSIIYKTQQSKNIILFKVNFKKIQYFLNNEDIATADQIQRQVLLNLFRGVCLVFQIIKNQLSYITNIPINTKFLQKYLVHLRVISMYGRRTFVVFRKIIQSFDGQPVPHEFISPLNFVRLLFCTRSSLPLSSWICLSLPIN